MGAVSPRRFTGFVRMWRIVVLLRCESRTVERLAEKLGVCTRTIRRDLEALQAVPLPITPRFATSTRTGIQRGQPNVWSFADTPAWPSQEFAPIADAVAGTVADGTPPQFAP